MKRIKRELTEEQYRRVIEKKDVSGIFTAQEVLGYGVYCERYFQDKEDGKYYVSFNLGDSCD